MDLLQHYQNQHPANEFFLPRKVQIPDSDKINLYGVRGSGKTTLVLDYLVDYDEEEILYIDCEDPNLRFDTLQLQPLDSFIKRENIQIFVLDHYHPSFLQELPKVHKLILLTREKQLFDDFAYTELFPLDYEEFLVFEKGISQSSSFNHFLKLGTLPVMARSTKNSNLTLKSFFQSKFDFQEQSLLILLCQHQTKHLTTNQLYTYAKEKFKVSKDWIYKTIKRFQSEGIIYFIDDLYQKGGKKMILFDFAFAKYLTIGQPFIIQFDTMVTLALIKHHISLKTLGIHGYVTLEGELIISAPFESEESMWKKSHTTFSLYKKYNINKVTIVTVANQYDFRIENILFDALPFYEWSILNEDSET